MIAALGRTWTELRRGAAELRGRWALSSWAGLAAVALAASVPFLSLPGVRTDGLADTLYLAVVATALGLAVGSAGLPVLGAGAFMAVGAFTTTLLVARADWPFEPAVLAGAAAALVGGGLTGGVVRLRGAFVAAATWLVAWLVWLFLLAFPSVSGGSQGLVLPPGTLLGLDPTPTVHFEAALVLLVIVALAVAAVRRGAPGLELSALRQAPALATSLGVRLGRRRLGAFAATAAVSGLVGGLAVQLQAVADPASYDPFLSFKLLAAVVIGGGAATLGPAAGVAILGVISLLAGGLARSAQLPVDRFNAAAAAVMLVLVISLGGEGLVPWLRRRKRRMPSPSPSVPAAGPAAAARNGVVLETRGLRKAFGGVVALDAFSLELRGGETTALIGPNGSGKTTALRLIAGTLSPDAGAVLVHGADISATRTPERVRLGIARTLQHTAAFAELTALENVLVGRSARRQAGGLVRTALATPRARSEVASDEAAAMLALGLVGLDHEAATPTSELTSSQRRMLALAAALASEPDVLLVDELAAGAGTDELDGLAGTIRGIRARGVAILLVEHNLALVRKTADRVAVLVAGRELTTGSPAEVSANDEVQQVYLQGRRL